jgi:two-component system, chemotaxis family, protein-glutamate methylesterase/glutaminase
MHPDFNIVVIGGSAGSLSRVLRLLPHLTKKLNITVVLIFHRKEDNESTLEDILMYKSEFSVKEIEDKDSILKHHIYIAPADYHSLLEKNLTFSLDFSEKVNFSRPSIDVTFESAADAFGESVIGLLLSGANADGVKGLHAIQNMGGRIAVQDPKSAEVPYMPQQAVNRLKIDLLLTEFNTESFLEWLKA